MKKILSIVALLVLTISSCKKKDDSPNGGGSNVILVTVQNEAGTAIAGAEVTVGSIKSTSDGSGKVTLSGVSVNDGKYNIKVVKDGYFEGYKNILRISETTAHNTTIKLIQKQVLGTVDANLPTTLSGGDYSLVFTGQGFVDKEGNSTTGNVTVYSRYISATDLTKLAELMPGGDFAAIGNNGEIGTLISMGFTATEFVDQNGKQVFPISGAATAEIQLPTDASEALSVLGANAWYYNDAINSWSYGGNVQKNGNKVKFEVKASIFGNCDAMSKKAKVKAKFYCNTKSNIQKGIRVQLINEGIALTGGRYRVAYQAETSENGEILVEVPVFPNITTDYSININGNLMPISLQENQTLDLGELDACNLSSLDVTTNWIIFNGIKYSTTTTHPFTNDTIWGCSKASRWASFGDLVDQNGNLFGVDLGLHFASPLNTPATLTSINYQQDSAMDCSYTSSNVFIAFYTFIGPDSSYGIKENQSVKVIQSGNNKVFQFTNATFYYLKSPALTKQVSGNIVVPF
jgi:hypothetical protein